MKTNLIILLLSYSFTVAAQNNGYPLTTSATINDKVLTQGFKTPPNESRLKCYWWWLNSYVTKASITRDLEQMKRPSALQVALL